MSEREMILERLDRLGIPHETFFHEAAHTMADCLKLPYAKEDVTFCKNILLCNRQKTVYWLYVTCPDKPFRTADVSRLLGVSRLSFAPQEDLPRLLHLESGSLSPLALWTAEPGTVRLALDRGIVREGRIAFHPCDNTATVIFTQEDFREKVLPALDSAPVWLSVPWPERGA